MRVTRADTIHHQRHAALIHETKSRGSRIVALTGAGGSAKSGTMNRPGRVAKQAAMRDACLVVGEPKPATFSELTERASWGVSLQGSARRWVADIVELIAPGALAWRYWGGVRDVYRGAGSLSETLKRQP